MTNQYADPNCPICGGSGYRSIKTDSIIPQIGPCSCLVRRTREMTVERNLDPERTNLPGMYADAEIDRLHERDGHRVTMIDRERNRPVERDQGDIDRENKTKLHSLAAAPLPPGAMVILTGPSGAGKTYGAAALLREQIRRYGKSGFYITSLGYLDAMRDQGINETERTALATRVKNVDVLFLDDLGIEKGSAYSMRVLWALIDERTKKGLATIVTSNLLISEVFGLNVDRKSAQLTDDQREALALGERIFSRFKEERFLIEWPKATTDWRGEAFKLKQQGAASISADRERRVRDLREQLGDSGSPESDDGR